MYCDRQAVGVLVVFCMFVMCSGGLKVNRTVYSTFFTVEGDINYETYPRFVAREAKKLKIRGYIGLDPNDTLDGFMEGKEERYLKMLEILKKGERSVEVPVVKCYRNATKPFYFYKQFHLRTEGPEVFNKTIDSDYVAYKHPLIWSTFFEINGNYSIRNLTRYVKENADSLKIRGYIRVNEKGIPEGFFEGEEESFKNMSKLLQEGYTDSQISVNLIPPKGKFKKRHYVYRLSKFQVRVSEAMLTMGKEPDIVRTRFFIFGNHIETEFTKYLVDKANEYGMHGYMDVVNKGSMAKVVMEAPKDSFDKLREELISHAKSLHYLNEIIFQDETLVYSFAHEPFHITRTEKSTTVNPIPERVLPGFHIKSDIIMHRGKDRTWDRVMYRVGDKTEPKRQLADIFQREQGCLYYNGDLYKQVVYQRYN